MKTNTPQRSWVQPFSGDDPQCPKCRSRHLTTEYHTAAVIDMCKEDRDDLVTLAEDPSLIEDEMTEHLCRGCETCGYAWREHVSQRG